MCGVFVIVETDVDGGVADRYLPASINRVARQMKQTLTVGKRVAEARASMKPPLTQLGLAKRLKGQGFDISKNGVDEIESGKRSAHHLELIVIAGVLNTTVNWLLGGGEP